MIATETDFCPSALSISSLALLGTIRLILTVAPLDHTIGSHTVGIGKRANNSAYVSLIRSQKVSDLGCIDFKPSIVINLRCAFEYRSPHPDDALDRLLGANGHRNKLLVAHHSCVMAEPTAHDRPAKVLAAPSC